MIGYWVKFFLILHKCFQVRINHYRLTILEITLPIIVSLLMTFLKVYEEDYLKYAAPQKFGEDAPMEDSYFEMEDPMILINEALGNNITIFYAPDNWYTQALVSYSQQKLQLSSYVPVSFYGFDSEETVARGEWKVGEIPNFFLFFKAVFSNGHLPQILHYRLTVRKENRELLGTVAITIQHLIALHFMEEVKGSDTLTKYTFTMQRFPMPRPKKDGSYIFYLSSYYFGFLVPICFIFAAPVFLANVVKEKQSGIKELMRLTGVPVSIQWLGFVITTFIFMFVGSLFIVLLMTSSYIFSHTEALIKHTSGAHLLIIFILYILSSIAFFLFLSALFSDASRAWVFGLYVYCATFLLPILLVDAGEVGKLSLNKKLVLALTPNMALFYALRFIAYQERQNGVHWNFYSSSPTVAEEIFLLPLLIMFVVDIILYWFLGWYINQLYPGPYGMPKRWYFFCTIMKILRTKPVVDVSDPFCSDDANFETELENVPKIVSVANITKVFKSLHVPPIVALDNVNFSVYKGEIFILLGHSGAGKTSITSIITGTYFPTSGSAYIFGYDIRKQTNQVRESMGYCPQATVLFPDLTVEQHLMLFGKLRGHFGRSLQKEVDTLLLKLKLGKKKGKLGKQLSRCSQRRLQLAIAIVGRVQFVVLDEPSNGLDPEFRHTFWNLLFEMRARCSILLSTSSVEEATGIGDRIAIMSHGKIMCCGSSTFLWHQFGGADYIMRITKAVGCDSTQVLQVVHRHVPLATIESNTHTELGIVLPVSYKNAFPELCDELEKNLEDFKISSFGFSTMSFEEIFRKINKSAENKQRIESKNLSQKNSSSTNFGKVQLLKNAKNQALNDNVLHIFKLKYVGWQQFNSLMMKRLYYIYQRTGFFIGQFMAVVLTAVIVILIVNKSHEREDIVFLLEKVFSNKRKQVVFEHHTSSEDCLPDAYISNIPNHVQIIKRLTLINLSDEIMATAKADILGFEYGHYVVAASFVHDEDMRMFANAMYYESLQGGDVYIKIASLNLVHNAILQSCAEKQRKILIDIQIADMKRLGEPTQHVPSDEFVNNYLHISIASSMLAVGLSLLCSCFIVLVTHEQLTQTKHLQLMTGVNSTLFWGAAFLFDYAFYSLCICSCMVIFVIFSGETVFSVSVVPGILLLAMMLFGWCAIPLAYFVSFFPNSTRAAYYIILAIHLAPAIVVGVDDLVIFVCYRKKGEPAPDVLIIISAIAQVFPAGCLTIIVLKVFMQALLAQAKNCWFFCSDYMTIHDNGVGRDLLLLWLYGVGYMSLVLLMDIHFPICWRVWLRLISRSKGEIKYLEREDHVEAEFLRIKDELARCTEDQAFALQGSTLNSGKHDVLLVDSLTNHSMRQGISVDELTFGVDRGECFGLLGLKGAGKTSTLRMLTGSMRLRSGDAILLDASLLSNRQKFLTQVGYCPETDALIEHLTPRQTLLVFARLRGTRENQVILLVDAYLKRFDLTEYAYKSIKTCRLETRRKLSLALALFASPTLVILDEPTNGLEPKARRKIWEIFASNKDERTAVIVASRSLYECEVLCTRLAIMKHGQLKYMDTIQQLKTKFGKGFKVLVKLPKTSDKQVQLAKYFDFFLFMENEFKDCALAGHREGYLEYSIPSSSANWQKLLTTLEEGKQKFYLDDYSIWEATLESAFLAFASDGKSDTKTLPINVSGPSRIEEKEIVNALM